MGRFGPRVIGKDRHDELREKAIRNPGHRFGPRVVGEVLNRKAEIKDEESGGLAAKKARASRKAAKEAENARIEDAKDEAPVEQVEAPILVSIKEMQEALDANPLMYETLYASELERAEGPRKGALRMFLAHELDNADRLERVEQVQTLLKG